MSRKDKKDRRKLFNKNDRIDLKWWEYIFYGLVPFNQVLLRAFKLDGSLDRSYMFFPLFLVPPFSFIPLLFAKFGFFQKGHGGKPLDIFVLAPIIVRFMLIFLFASYKTIPGIIYKVILTILSMMITNLFRVMYYRNCNDDDTKLGNLISISFFDSCMQYASGMGAEIAFLFIPFIGQIYELIEMIPIGGIKYFMDEAIWSLGFAFMYLLLNMIDGKNEDDKGCQPRVKKGRIIFGILGLVFAVGKEAYNRII